MIKHLHAHVLHRQCNDYILVKYNISSWIRACNISNHDFVFSSPSVQISGTQTLRGLFLQARAVGSSEPIGEWITVPGSFQTRDCSSTADAVTHTENSDKNPSDLSFVWRAPSSGIGNIQFLWVYTMYFFRISRPCFFFNKNNNGIIH